MSTTIPRFMVAAPSSGSGKTVVTCALLRALARRGLACAAFKCGPDYIDPLFHRRVVGARSGNLDGFFTDAPTLRALLARGAAGADVAVLEGAMGFYDGMAPGVADASSYQVACDTETPVVLVVNGRGASLSLAAVIRGIAEFLPCANVRGVVLNKTSAAACAYAKPAIEKHTGVAVLGNIPADDAFSLESRHLGLVTADEVEQLSARIDKMAELVEKSVDVDCLLEIAATAPDIREDPYRLEPIAGARPIVAVARDEAFSFYYEENLRALEDLGCELAFFSPLCDSELPRGTSALYLGAATRSSMRGSSQRTRRCARRCGARWNPACRRSPNAVGFCTCSAKSPIARGGAGLLWAPLRAQARTGEGCPISGTWSSLPNATGSTGRAAHASARTSSTTGSPPARAATFGRKSPGATRAGRA